MINRDRDRDREGERVAALSLKVNGQWADSVHPTEKPCSFYHLGIHRHSRERAGMRDRGELVVGAKYIVRGKEDTTQTVLNIKRDQGFYPWSPPQEGAPYPSSFARWGLPSKGEARALHHQPAPALTLTMPCLLLSLDQVSNAQTLSKNPQLTVTKIWRNAQNYRKIRAL